jgi:hypothetical protein
MESLLLPKAVKKVQVFEREGGHFVGGSLIPPSLQGIKPHAQFLMSVTHVYNPPRQEAIVRYATTTLILEGGS